MLRLLRRGDIGPDVKAIQEGLNKSIAGVPLNPDGKFGQLTDTAVRQFQAKHRLKVDGIVGPRTRSRLFPLVATTINVMGLRLPRIGERAGPAHRLLPQPSSGFQPLQLPPLQFPVPAPAPPLIPVPKLKFDQFQLQPGTQTSFTNLFQDPQSSWAFTLQSIFKRGEDDGRQELALGVQAGSPLFITGPDGANTSVSWFANYTWVDPLGALGQFHLWSPFATIGSQTDTSSGKTTIGAGLFPINLNIDIEKDRLSFQVNSGVVGTYDTDSREMKWSVQTTFGVSGTVTLF